mmetsp:Transcript_8086/g.27089  ORF Transcript_8086/g.27089 Transcript_8086/m.27089 type:complete len:214 (+) Transcript_8086:293-934(+)
MVGPDVCNRDVSFFHDHVWNVLLSLFPCMLGAVSVHLPRGPDLPVLSVGHFSAGSWRAGAPVCPADLLREQERSNSALSPLLALLPVQDHAHERGGEGPGSLPHVDGADGTALSLCESVHPDTAVVVCSPAPQLHPEALGRGDLHHRDPCRVSHSSPLPTGSGVGGMVEHFPHGLHHADRQLHLLQPAHCHRLPVPPRRCLFLLAVEEENPTR